MHRSWRSVISEKRSTDLLLWAVSQMSPLCHPSIPFWRSYNIVPATQFSCQWHLHPCGPSHSLKRLFSCPGRTHKHILLNAVGGGGNDFTVGTWIGNSRRPLLLSREALTAESGLISVKGEWQDGEDKPTFFTSLPLYLERRGKQMLAAISGSFLG